MRTEPTGSLSPLATDGCSQVTTHREVTMPKSSKYSATLVPVTSALALYAGGLVVTPGLATLTDRHMESKHPVLQSILRVEPVNLADVLVAHVGEYAKCHTKACVGPVEFSKEGNCPKEDDKKEDKKPDDKGEKKSAALEAQQLVEKLLLA